MTTKFYSKLTIAIIIMMSSSGLFAQKVISEYSRMNQESPFKMQRQFDESKYTKFLDDNGKRLYIQNQPISQNAPNGENNAEEVTLSINLDFDSEQFEAPSLILIYDEYGYFNFGFYQGTNTIEITVPEGVYDILADFTKTSSERTYTIIKEQQSILENTSISLNPVEANNYISVNALDENGEALEPGIEDPVTGEPAVVFFSRNIIFNPTSGTVGGILYMSDIPSDDNPIWNFYINNVSNRYSIIHNFTGLGYEMGYYFTKFETLQGIENSKVLENNPESWVYHLEAFQPSNLATGSIHPGYSTSTIFNGNYIEGWMNFNSEIDVNPNEGFKGYINNTLDDDPAQFIVTPCIVEFSVVIDPIPFDLGVFLHGSPLTTDGENRVLYGTVDPLGTAGLPIHKLLSSDYYLNQDLQYKVLPFHPKFSFSSEITPNPVQGNNVPFVISAIDVNPGSNNSIRFQHKGNFSEIRESDFFATQTEVKQNGNVVFSGDYSELLSYVFPTSGNIEITLIDANTTIEGQEGINTTTITYNADQDDAPPTLQHLQFRDTNDKVTSIFDSAENASVRIAAGDFKFIEASGYYDYNPGNAVEFYYSPYNQNNWTELELTEYPEYFQMPAFGDYYEASLADVVVPEDNMWFDVRIICTDAAGNKQEQVISPAFKVEQSNMGTNEVNPSGLAVYPNPFTNEIKIKLPEYIKRNYDFKVSDITGKTIYRKNQNERSFVWNGSSLPKGVYILSIESNGKTIAKKVVKK